MVQQTSSANQRIGNNRCDKSRFPFAINVIIVCDWFSEIVSFFNFPPLWQFFKYKQACWHREIQMARSASEGNEMFCRYLKCYIKPHIFKWRFITNILEWTLRNEDDKLMTAAIDVIVIHSIPRNAFYIDYLNQEMEND